MYPCLNLCCIYPHVHCTDDETGDSELDFLLYSHLGFLLCEVPTCYTVLEIT